MKIISKNNNVEYLSPFSAIITEYNKLGKLQTIEVYEAPRSGG
jgi:hypothetical protein